MAVVVVAVVVVVRNIPRCCYIAAAVHCTSVVVAVHDLNYCSILLTVLVVDNAVLDSHLHNIDLQVLRNFECRHRRRRHNYSFLDHWCCNIAVVGII